MKTASIGTVDLKSAELPRSRFDWKSTLHSTLQFGEVVPAYCQYMDAGDKLQVRSSERVLAAPLLAPVFGKATLKAVHQFVPLSDLTANHAPMMAQQGVARGAGTVINPTYDFCMTLRDLSFICLWGSKLTLYASGKYSGLNPQGEDPDVVGATLFEYDGSDGSLSSSDPGYSCLNDAGILEFSFSRFGLTNSARINVARLLNDRNNVNLYRDIPLSNPSPGSFFNVLPSSTYYELYSEQFDLDTVPLDKADALIPLFWVESNEEHLYYYAFRLSSFGKRLKKWLNVQGYELNFNTDVLVNVYPLLAGYKAYFDLYQPQLYTNWEQTYASRLLKYLDLQPNPIITDFWKYPYASWPTQIELLQNFFVYELGATFFTEEQNFASSHIRNSAVSPSPEGLRLSIDTDVSGTNYYRPQFTNTDVSSSEPSDLTSPNGHAYINNVYHGQLDSELLMKLYRWTNRNTIAGRRIAEILRAQGLGKYVDDCKNTFIGAFSVPLNVYDMLSSADTYSKAADSGAPLGERAGNGQAESQERLFEYEASEPGYWITLVSIVPEGGFAESLAPHVLAVKKFDYHHADFDSVGYEFDPKLLVQGSQPVADFVSSSGSLADSFGQVPRYFRWKFPRNVMTGDFTLRSARDSVAPYSLEKYVDVGNRVSHKISGASTREVWSMAKLFKPADMPIAGNVWRYPTRYPFIGQFNRIFNYSTGTYERWYRNVGTSQSEYEFFGWMADNFIFHMYFDAVNWQKKLPVSKSFETDEDGKFDSSMGKA